MAQPARTSRPKVKPKAVKRATSDLTPGSRVGVKQIADELSLGTSTVAHALAGNGTISERTRRRVLDHAAKVGYVPDRNARRMRAKRTGVIGLLVPDVVLNYNEIVQHVFRNVTRRGDEVQIALTEFDDDLEDRAIAAMLESRVDGILIKTGFDHWSQVPKGHALRRAVAAKVPVLLWSHRIEGVNLPAIHTPYREQARIVAEHLIEQGCRSLGLVLPIPDALLHPAHSAHVDGVRDAIAAAGLPKNSLRIAKPTSLEVEPAHADESFGNYIDQSIPRIGVEMGHRLTTQMCSGGKRLPEGFVFQNDLMAVGGMRALRDAGISVPDQVRVGVLNHTIAGEMSGLTLTHSRIEQGAAAEAALDLLYQLIASERPLPKNSGDPVMAARLVVGQSSCPNRATKP